MDIIATLKNVLNLSDSVKISVYPAGAVNRVYRVQESKNSQLSLRGSNPQNGGLQKQEDTSVDLAVKWLADDDFSGVNRAHQFALQQQLYREGIAPEPVWLSEDETIWVEQWLDHSNCTAPSTFELAKTLARVHSLPINAKGLDLALRWQHYRDVAQLDRSSELYLKAQALLKTVKKTERDNDDYVLCHNDLLTSHLFINSDNTFKIIDWEYAAMGNRYFDLASCCLINKLAGDGRIELVKHYAELMNINEAEAFGKFELFIEIVSLTNDLWFAALNANNDK
ncbi:phosphotransferase [Alteromonas sp. S015]|uniref:phosphotransferase n=1 Tax=Alteromonas sp. S015 TaxID=3117401 RepID=UPI002FE4151E